MFLQRVLQDEKGAIIISVLLGLGLAAMFRRACTGDSCVIARAPSAEDLKRHTYRIDSSCYKYSPEAVACPWPKAKEAQGTQG